MFFSMGPCIVRKIARLLDIEFWNLMSNHEDLSGCILNFLMEKKCPGTNLHLLSFFLISKLYPANLFHSLKANLFRRFHFNVNTALFRTSDLNVKIRNIFVPQLYKCMIYLILFKCHIDGHCSP